jgi:hydrophobic/amphiphilic exporter-1 (mainly G- bacteria), HAE1 family
MSITQIAIKRSTLVVVVFSILTVLGLVCYTMLNYNMFPKMDIPVVSVTTQYPGASASVVENSVTKKLEDALSSLENMDYMTSSSQEGVSSVTLTLLASANADKALEDAQRKVNQILSDLPTGVKTPSLSKFSSDDTPVLKLGIRANMPDTKLYLLTKEHIKSQLAKIQGVGQVSLIGGNEREIRINVNRDKLDAYKLSISQIYQAVSNSNLELPTGKIESSLKQYTVRLSGKVTSLDELRNMVVSKDKTGSTIKLSDIAEVTDGVGDPSNLNRINGENSIGVVIQKLTDANSVKVCQLVKKELGNIEKLYASDNVKFDVASDNSVYTLESANAVMEDLCIAIILVAIIMFLFLHSVRNSFIVLISIPTSIISVFTCMYVLNFSLNMLTLMALSLVIGILVDDSIVVLENITRHLQMGKNKEQAALDGRSEIGFTAVAITMVDIVVFVPLSLVMGMIGNMLREFSLVVVFSTLMSLFVSFTITPLLASRIAKLEKLTWNTWMGKLGLKFEELYNKLVIVYERILRWSLKHRKVVYSLVSVLIVLSFSLIIFGFIGTEFITNGDRGEFVIKLEGEPQNTLYQTNILTQKVEDILSRHPEVTKIFSNVGYSSTSGFMGTGSSEQHKSEITVTLVNKKMRNQSVDDFSLMVKREILNTIPGVKITTAAVSITGGANDAPIQVLLRGSDLNKVYDIADSVKAIVKSISGTSDIQLSVEKSKPEMRITLNREKMSLLGLSVYSVGTTLNLAFAGNTDLQYTDEGEDYDINVKFDQFDRKKVDNIGSLTFTNNNGETIELRQFAEIYQSLGPSKLERYNRMSSLTVKAAVFGRPTGTVGAEIKEAISKKIHDPGINIEYKGDLERQSEAFSSLFTALMAAIILVYCVMVALYNSYLYPFVVLFSIPVAIIGALFALALSGETISIFSIIGMIMLIGLVAKNAILLVDFTNHLREKGAIVTEALVEAGKERLRPILMTTVAMVFGMLPLATATGAGSESKNGLAWVIIGGLLSSLLFTLVLVPCVYTAMENIKGKIAQRIKQRKLTAEPVINS